VSVDVTIEVIIDVVIDAIIKVLVAMYIIYSLQKKIVQKEKDKRSYLLHFYFLNNDKEGKLNVKKTNKIN
jgi:phosphate/sulfate permease